MTPKSFATSEQSEGLSAAGPTAESVGAVPRREFLKAGALSASALVASACGAESTGQKPAAPDDPVIPTPDEIDAAIQRGFAQSPPFGDPEFDEAAALNCPVEYGHPLGQPDESTCAAMSVIWGFFGRGVSDYTSDVDQIDYSTIEEGIRYIRGAVRREVQQLPGNNLNRFKFDAYRAPWEELGRITADKADKASSKLTRTHFEAAWQEKFGNKAPEPYELTNLVDQAAEVIGDHLWLGFSLGVLAGVDKPYDYKIIERGRVLSRRFIIGNVTKLGVVTGNSVKPDYSKWNFAMAGKCGMQCGRRAKRVGAGSKITPGDLRKAWCKVSEGQKRVAQGRGFDVKITSLACT